MKNYSWILVAAAMAPLVPLACSSETGTTSTSTGTGGTTGAGGTEITSTTGSNTTGTNTTGSNTTGTNTTSASSSSSGTGGGEPVDCTGILDPNDCATCAEGSCCQELVDCNDDADCLSCLSAGADPAVCDVNEPNKALFECLNTSCNAECFTATPPCNPVTGAGCDVAGGATCDLESGGSFVCFPPPNTAILCGACNNQNGPFCAAGMGCLGGSCARYCCTDADCGTGTCDTAAGGADGVGVCVSTADKTKPSCDAPAVSVSMGTCFGAGTSSSSASSSSASSSSASSSSASSSSASSSSASSSSASSSSSSGSGGGSSSSTGP